MIQESITGTTSPYRFIIRIPAFCRVVIVTVVLGLLAGMVEEASAAAQSSGVQGVRVGTYEQEVGLFFGPQDGPAPESARWVVVGRDNQVYAGSPKGVFGYGKEKWDRVKGLEGKSAKVLFNDGNQLMVAVGEAVFEVKNNQSERVGTLEGVRPGKFRIVPLVTSEGLISGCVLDTGKILTWKNGKLEPLAESTKKMGGTSGVQQLAKGPDGELAVACEAGLFLKKEGSGWTKATPEEGKRKWLLYSVKGVAYDRKGRLWFACPYGVGCREKGWSLYTGREGLPYDDFTTVVPGKKGAIWFGTRIGAIRFDGQAWEYREGRRWLPGDQVHGIAVDEKGNAWFATDKGVGAILRKPMTLAEKAKYFEDRIDARHRRTPYGYVLEARLKRPGDLSEWTNHDSDNDGLWTSMYAAGECFAYAATKDPQAKQRAEKAFQAIRFLSQVTQGGTHPAPHGFPARSILPTDGPNPNDPSGGPERDRRNQQNSDSKWKILYPRWPTSEDGKWYWKTDTSSDELDGHFFLYATYYDLVAETELERKQVREVVMAITDHLLDHNFNLVDWDGKPTRWSRFSPEELNFDPSWWEERGLNSLSILSYLKVAEHVSGGAERYRKAYDDLIENHSYAQNMLVPKIQQGPGTGNESDNEMAFMSYYNLLKYETDPELKSQFAFSLFEYWKHIEPELNPLFNYIAMASLQGLHYDDPWNHFDLSPSRRCLEEAADTLKRFPMNLVQWSLKNSHRIDLLPIPSVLGIPDHPLRKGYRTNGRVLPIDERFVEHWNHDPWQLDYGGNGRNEADGAAFLLPYYMGLYHGFIIED